MPRPLERPIIGITIGDPAGIGPEVTAKALAHEAIRRRCRPVVIGDARIMRRAARWCGLQLGARVLASPAQAAGRPGTMEILHLQNIAPAEAKPGRLSPACGRAAVEYVFKAIDLATAGELDAVVTAPLNKEAMRLAGFSYDGHTEIFAERTGTKDVCMMLVVGRMRALHVSTHRPLLEACQRVKRGRVLAVLRLSRLALADLGVAAPRVGVAGLNPHAGEQGLFGREEMEEIAPAIEAARREGIDARGPFPPDTIFHRARRGEFDCVIAMYHDQGHIPMKLLGFDRGVNVTVGLPIIRTSVDHGTAFDIAGKGIAHERSLMEALDVAIRMVRNRRTGREKSSSSGS